MAVKLEKSIKRELDLDGRAYTIQIAPEGIKVTEKGKRKGREISWRAIISGDAQLAEDLKLSIDAFCYKENQIKLDVRNIGQEEIAEIRLVITSKIVKEEKTILGSGLKKGQSLSVEVPFSNAPGTTVGILPARGTPDEPFVCPELVHAVTDLPPCS